MKRTALIVLLVLTVFTTYFYIPSNSSAANNQSLKAFAADDGYFFAATCDRDINNLLIPPGTKFGTDITFNFFRIEDSGKKIEISFNLGSETINKQYAYDSYNTTSNSAAWKDTSAAAVTTYVVIQSVSGGVWSGTRNNTVISDQKTYMGGSAATDETYTKLGNYGQLMKAFNIGGGATNIDPKTCAIFDPSASVDISLKDGNPPTVHLEGSTGLGRPAMDFKLAHVIVTSSPSQNIFYFTYSGAVEKFKNIAIKMLPDSSGQAVSYGDLNNYDDDSDNENGLSTTTASAKYYLPSHTDIKLSDAEKKNFHDFLLNKVYNKKAEGGSATVCGAVVGPTLPDKVSNLALSETPELQCLNISDNGYLKSWGVTVNQATYTDPDGTAAKDECTTSILSMVKDPFLYAFCKIALFFRDIAQSIMCFAQIRLKDSLGMLDISNGPDSTCSTGAEQSIPSTFNPAKSTTTTTTGSGP